MRSSSWSPLVVAALRPSAVPRKRVWRDGGNFNILSNDFNNNNVAIGVLSNILQV